MPITARTQKADASSPLPDTGTAGTVTAGTGTTDTRIVGTGVGLLKRPLPMTIGIFFSGAGVSCIQCSHAVATSDSDWIFCDSCWTYASSGLLSCLSSGQQMQLKQATKRSVAQKGQNVRLPLVSDLKPLSAAAAAFWDTPPPLYGRLHIASQGESLPSAAAS